MRSSDARPGGGRLPDLPRTSIPGRAWGDLISRRVGSHRELVRRGTSGRLTRSTIGAILRHERSLSYDVLDQVLVICGVSGVDRQAWMDAWERYGKLRRDAMDFQRRAIAYGRLEAKRVSVYSGTAS